MQILVKKIFLNMQQIDGNIVQIVGMSYLGY